MTPYVMCATALLLGAWVVGALWVPPPDNGTKIAVTIIASILAFILAFWALVQDGPDR